MKERELTVTIRGISSNRNFSGMSRFFYCSEFPKKNIKKEEPEK